MCPKNDLIRLGIKGTARFCRHRKVLCEDNLHSPYDPNDDVLLLVPQLLLTDTSELVGGPLPPTPLGPVQQFQQVLPLDLYAGHMAPDRDYNVTYWLRSL